MIKTEELTVSELLEKSKEINGLKPNALMNDFFVNQFTKMIVEEKLEEQKKIIIKQCEASILGWSESKSKVIAKAKDPKL